MLKNEQKYYHNCKNIVGISKKNSYLLFLRIYTQKHPDKKNKSAIIK